MFHVYFWNKYQRAITRFRASSVQGHRLGSELGRHHKSRIPVEERIYKFCNLGEIDDEYHFLIHYEFHANSRAVLYSRLQQYKVDYNRLEDDDKFKQILVSTDKEALHITIHDGFRSHDLSLGNKQRWLYWTFLSCIDFLIIWSLSFISNHGAC